MLLWLLSVIQREVVVELGSGSFQVWQLRRGQGNPIEIVLNSQSGRKTASAAYFDGQQLLVGEKAIAAGRRNPDRIFTHFTHFPEKISLDFAANPEAPELAEMGSQKVIVMLQAIFEHITKNMLSSTGGSQQNINSKNNIQFTLINPPQWSFTQLHAIQQAINQVDGAELALTVSTPEAVVVSYLGQRIREIGKTNNKEFIVVDVGSTTTTASLVRVNVQTPESDLTQNVSSNNQTRTFKAAKVPQVNVQLVNTTTVNVGGYNLTKCLVDLAQTKLPNLKEGDLKITQKLYDAVEKAKIKLSGSETAKVHIEGGNTDNSDAQTILKKEYVDECLKDLYLPSLINQLTDIETSTLEDHEKIIHLFYGGGARVPSVQKLIEKSFETSFLKVVNLDEGASYGGGLLTARTSPGFRMAAHFISESRLRPKLIFNNSNLNISHIDGIEQIVNDHKQKSKSTDNGSGHKHDSTESWEQLYLVNSLEKHNMTIKVPVEWLQKLKLQNHTFQVIHVSTQTKSDNSSENQNAKKQDQTYNTESIEYQQIDIDGGNLGTLQFAIVNKQLSDKESSPVVPSADDLIYNCMIDIQPIDTTVFTKKYEMKDKDNSGVMPLGFGIIRSSRLKDLQGDVQTSSKRISELYEKLQKLNSAKKWYRENPEGRIEISLIGDGIGIPKVQALLAVYSSGRKGAQLTDALPLRVQCFSSFDDESFTNRPLNLTTNDSSTPFPLRISIKDLKEAKRFLKVSDEVQKQKSQFDRLHNVLDATFIKAKLELKKQKELASGNVTNHQNDSQNTENRTENSESLRPALNKTEITEFEKAVSDVDSFLQSIENEYKCNNQECVQSVLEKLESLLSNIKVPLDLIRERETEASERPKAIIAFQSAFEQIQQALKNAQKLIPTQEQNMTEQVTSNSKLDKVLDICALLKNLQAKGMERSSAQSTGNESTNKSEVESQKGKKSKKKGTSGGIDNMFFKELLDHHYETQEQLEVKGNNESEKSNITKNEKIQHNSTELALFVSQSLRKSVFNALRECSSLSGSLSMIKRQLQQIHSNASDSEDFIEELQKFKSRIETEKNLTSKEIAQKAQQVLKIASKLDRRVSDLQYESTKSRVHNIMFEVENRLLQKQASGVAIYAIKKVLERNNVTGNGSVTNNNQQKITNATIGRTIVSILNQANEHTDIKALKVIEDVQNNQTQSKKTKTQNSKKQTQTNTNQFNNNTINELFMEKLLDNQNLTQQITDMRLELYEDTLDKLVDVYNQIIDEMSINVDDLDNIDNENANKTKDEL